MGEEVRIEYTYDELVALHEIARILSDSTDIRDQLRKVLDVLSGRLGMQRGMISVLDMTTGEVWLDVAQGMSIPPGAVTYRLGEGITGRVAQTGRPIAVANLSNEIHFLDRTGARKSLNRSELSFLCVPVKFRGRVVGVLSVDKLAQNVVNLDREVALLSSVAELLGKVVYYRAVEEENLRLRKVVADARRPKTDIVGKSKGIEEVLRLIDQVADSNMTVLIYGETGTGKELVARAIHENSKRASGPLVRVNCAAIPDTLLESELFGHEKGAFTGAMTRRRGRFEEAHKGTIFLDEVGELSPTAQAKLLRVLQEKEFEPLGSSRVVRVDVRVIAATNKNLEEAVEQGKFRADLYFRLNAFPIYIPPLRERGADILLLADHFVCKYAKEFGKPVRRISTSAIEMLMSYHWPGNVRELENCIERAVLLAEGDTIDAVHLPPSLQMKKKSENEPVRGKLETLVGTYERDLIVDALKETRGNISEAARILGTTRRIIHYKAKKYGIDLGKLRGTGA
ncbi:sigma-54 interaction domain-containing protein [Thermodesulforhabdus norvegica]|uniref:Nif-specific regulatory protein n=1 Tax=Thermodesulforhabdus norvegica TaxID=39841 RepID=A0A1I4VK59_9BACT|nr:sigma 54-interacting transcriptional regulator [Thermodesulforhabdus norvegica]SFN01628.1 Nif-specific regulatory protein [Thermodesulforhabdus norvegica]